MTPSRHLIRRAFDQAAATYDSAAGVQRHVCQRLADGLPEGCPPDRILDAGCGTGYGLRLLLARFPAAQGIGVDLALAMLAQVQALPCAAGDIEDLPLASDSFALYWSSLTAQWCELPRVLQEAHRVLRPTGRLALSTLGPATFSELREAFSAGDNYSHTLAFIDPETLPARLTAAGFGNIAIEREALVTHHRDLKSLLGSVKAIGANQHGGQRRRGLMSRAAFARAAAAYESLRQPEGLPLTYDLLYLYGQK